jgi:hypothetical protein
MIMRQSKLTNSGKIIRHKRIKSKMTLGLRVVIATSIEVSEETLRTGLHFLSCLGRLLRRNSASEVLSGRSLQAIYIVTSDNYSSFNVADIYIKANSNTIYKDVRYRHRGKTCK